MTDPFQFAEPPRAPFRFVDARGRRWELSIRPDGFRPGVLVIFGEVVIERDDGRARVIGTRYSTPLRRALDRRTGERFVTGFELLEAIHETQRFLAEVW